MRHPVNFVLESLDVLCLLQKFLLRDKQGKEGFLVVTIKQFMQALVHKFADCKSVREPYVEPFYGIADIHDLRTPQKFVIPLGKILFVWQGACIFVHKKTS